ncbi:sigma-70 family RNA polymerase sigma factor [Calycomorphotria hydatis]|uniref:sigma-70 family RNA polymerase sigma factor n=1 Tax=Calycomorphotria hydatis TaxID=2528027 RepID=UPI0018D24225|nr:sigma-70 family RNA polymerase sigma factor [Calycomorphotria hydatis]
MKAAVRQNFMALPESNQKQRDEFLELFSAAREELRSYVGALVVNIPDADDVFQELCLTLWRRFDDFESGTNFLAWGRAIALNAARTYWRSKVGRRESALIDEALERLSRVHKGQTEFHEFRREGLKKCIGQLSQRDQNFIERVYGDGVSIRQLASRSGKSPNAFYKRLSRLRMRVRQCLEGKSID